MLETFFLFLLTFRYPNNPLLVFAGFNPSEYINFDPKISNLG